MRTPSNFNFDCDALRARARRPRDRRQDAGIPSFNLIVVQGLGLNTNVLLTRSLLLMVLPDPGFEALSGSGVFAGKSEGCDIGVGDTNFFRAAFGDHAESAVGEGGAFVLAIEYVALDLLASF